MNIPEEILNEIYRHARAEFPNECCGWLAGPRDGEEVARVRRAVNAYDPASHPTANDRTAETAYVIDGDDLMELNRALDDEEPPLVIYHSHPNGQAYFSQTDRKVATDPWTGDGPVYPVKQLVIGIDGERVVEARLFEWVDSGKKFVPVAEFPGAEI